jgi:hypothetical protein
MGNKVGFRSNSTGDLYAYFEDGSGGSCAIGTDFGDNSKLKIVMSDILTDVTPSGTFQLSIDPDTNGDIIITPRGSGDLIVSSLVKGVVQSDSIGTLSASNGSDGQVLIAATAGTPSWHNLTAGTGVSITNAANSITINSIGGGMTWTIVVGASQNMAINNGYIEEYGVATCFFVLPTSAPVGSIIEATSTTTNGLRIVQNGSNDNIRWAGTLTTMGPTGYIETTQRWSSIKLVKIDASVTGNWNVLSSTGNWTIV